MGVFDLFKKEKVVVRVAPSPTGFLHIGTARTMLFNYLFAKKHNGKIILRSEDTDKARSKSEHEEDIMSGLEWLGLTHDEFFRQSERNEIYEKYTKQLIDSGHAYVSKEEVKEEGQRAEVIRFKNPNKSITFHDLIRGEITFDTTELGDFIIARSISEPLYHLAVVIDDIEMGVTHIIRGEDHISNTPRQILMIEAFGKGQPDYAHIPLIFDDQKAKLSKRKHGELVSITYYKNNGYLPEAMVNYLALVGWNPGTEQEIFSMDELIEQFDLAKVQKGGAVFNPIKLKSINRHYIKQLPLGDIENRILEIRPELDKEIIKKITPLVAERLDTLSDIKTLFDQGEFDYFFNAPKINNPEAIIWKKDTKENAVKHLEKVKQIIENTENCSVEIMKYAEETGKGNVLWPLRYALSGREKSSDPFTILGIIGKHESISRILTATHLLS